MKKINIAILIACHNRKKLTLACLKSLYNQKNNKKIKFTVFLVDDGSTDGTSKFVNKYFPKVNIIKGNGNLYWTRGMFKAWKHASKKKFKYYLWLNDDVFLYSNALENISKNITILSNTIKNNLYISSFPTYCNLSKKISYGGVMLQDNFFKFNFLPLKKKKKIVHCDSFNGNCVLVTDTTFKLVGNFDKNYFHGGGDHDYGLTAKKLGVKIFVHNNYIGICRSGKYNKSKPVMEHDEWLYFLKKHSKYWITHSLKFLITNLLRKVKIF